MGINNKQSGFTIIETMFFLAISGLMMVGLAMAMSNMINSQRYNDSVNRLKSALQDEYNSVVNVRNDRKDIWNCTQDRVGGLLSIHASDSGTNRGASGCVLLGRYIQFFATGSDGSWRVGREYKSYPVYGLKVDNYSTADDLSVSSMSRSIFVNDSKITIDTNGTTGMSKSMEIDWQNEWATPLIGSDRKGMGILILRNPQNGQIMTISTDRHVTTEGPVVKDFAKRMLELKDDNMYGEFFKVCIKDGNRKSTAVLIRSNSSSSAGVVTESCN